MSKLLYFTEKEEEYFFSKIKEGSNPDNCWEWVASTRNGYGSFRLRDKIVDTHRLMYELAYGEIPKGVHCLHTCDNPSCVNPAHLFLGTQQDNVNDMYSKGRQSRVGNRGNSRGEDHGNSILTEEDVLEIRSLYSEGKFTQQEIANTFCISKRQVCFIVNRKRWKHI